MKKRVNPVSILIVVISVIGSAFGLLLIFNSQVPEGLIVIGCSVILTALPSLMKPVEQSDVRVESKESDAITLSDVENASVLCKFAGRCRIGDMPSQDCTLLITEISVEFLSIKGKKIAALLRKNITSVKIVNSHTIVLNISDIGDYKFVCNDTNAIDFINQLLNHAA